MSNSTVKLSNVWAEFVIEWFYNSITQSGGDGAAVICCSNPAATSRFFLKWWREKYLGQMKRSGYKLDSFYHPMDIYKTPEGSEIINFHDGNENFMFCDSMLLLAHGDLSFIVEGDCPSFDTFVIKEL